MAQFWLDGMTELVLHYPTVSRTGRRIMCLCLVCACAASVLCLIFLSACRLCVFIVVNIVCMTSDLTARTKRNELDLKV